MDVKKLINNSQQFIEELMWIKTKQRKLVRLKLNSAQQRLITIVSQMRSEHRPVRIIVLKARQQGISTIVEALLYHDTITHPNTNSLIIADKREKADYLFSISKLFYDMSPEQFRPMFRCRSKQEITFENPIMKESANNPGLRSMIRIDTAQDIEAGRAMTLQNVHGSEVAFWGRRAEELVGSILQSVPFITDSMVFLESTGNMTGGYFYDEWLRAKKGESAFVPLFLAWHDFEEYKLPLTYEEKGYFPLSEEEDEIKKRFHLTNGQVKWRREKLKEFKSPDLFAREYPSDEIEAFLSGGSPVYDLKALRWYKKNHCKDPLAVGNLSSIIDSRGGRKVVFSPHASGYLNIWEHPKKDEEYVVGADTAEGIQGGDFCCAQVLKKSNLEQVAEWVGLKDPDLFSRDVEYLGTYYNSALIGVEVNNHGLTTLNVLKQNYWNIYYRQVFDELGNKWVTKIGWHTNSTTRPLMVDDLGMYIRERRIFIHSKELLEELITFIYSPTGKTGAQYGTHDDRVTALQVALQVLQSTPKMKMEIKVDNDELIEYGELMNPLTVNKKVSWYNL